MDVEQILKLISDGGVLAILTIAVVILWRRLTELRHKHESLLEKQAQETQKKLDELQDELIERHLDETKPIPPRGASELLRRYGGKKDDSDVG